MFLIFDTETTGLPRTKNAPLSDFDNWPRVVQLAWQLHDSAGGLLNHDSIIIKPEGFIIPAEAEKIHGISTETAVREGNDLKETLIKFTEIVNKAEFICGHNVKYDLNAVACELLRMNMPNMLKPKKFIDTNNDQTTKFCAIDGGPGWSRYKWPSLSNLYKKLFDSEFSGAHNAAFDVEATAKVLFETIKRGIVTIEGIDASRINYQAPDLSHLLTPTT